MREKKIKTKNLISLPDFCREISISEATGRNWLRLKKIKPTAIRNTKPMFSVDYVNGVKADIQNGTSSVLRSRRNKKYISGNVVYNSYISKKSGNINIVNKIVDNIEKSNIKITGMLISELVADCAYKLARQKGYEQEMTFLIDDLKNKPNNIRQRYPELFDFDFVYEENEDIPGFLYISLKNTGERKAKGEYYTPTLVVRKMCENLFNNEDVRDKTVIDPCCGTGNFLLQLPDDIAPQNIFACDTDKTSVKIARLNIALKYGIFDRDLLYNNIRVANYLNTGFSEQFDFVIGNPPWGYAYSDKEKNRLSKKYTCAKVGNIESYDVFTEKALNDLKQGGKLAFVLPTAILNVLSHKNIRQYITEVSTAEYIEFLGNIFDGVHCPCIVLKLLKTENGFNTKGMTVCDGKRSYIINTSRDINIDCFCFNMTDEEYAVLNKLENCNKTTLKGNADFALGIVTGKNSRYISKTKQPKYETVVKGSDIYKFRIEPVDRYIRFTPENFQQTAPEKYYRAEEKLIYRFICNQLVFAYDDKQRLSLNSGNILIPKIPGMDMKYILAVLNSKPAQFYFRKRFNSVKVLRAHIEKIPIPIVDSEMQSKVVELTEEIMNCCDDGEVKRLYDELNVRIAEVYGLTDEEFGVVKNATDGENEFLGVR